MKRFSNLLRTLPTETKYAIITLVLPFNENKYTLIVSSPLCESELFDFFASRSYAEGVQIASLSVFDDIDEARKRWAKMRATGAFEEEIYGLDSLARLIRHLNSFQIWWKITLDNGTTLTVPNDAFCTQSLDSLADSAYTKSYKIEKIIEYTAI